MSTLNENNAIALGVIAFIVVMAVALALSLNESSILPMTMSPSAPTHQAPPPVIYNITTNPQSNQQVPSQTKPAPSMKTSK